MSRYARYNDALTCLDQMAMWRPFHPNIGLLRARTLYHLSLDPSESAIEDATLYQALSSLDQCLANAGKVFAQKMMPGATSWNAHGWKGLIHLRLRRPELALLDYEIALREQGKNLSLNLGYAEALLGCGRPADALDRLQPLLVYPSADALILAALSCSELGQAERACEFKQAAVNKLPQGLIAQHRGLLLSGLGAPDNDKKMQAIFCLSTA